MTKPAAQTKYTVQNMENKSYDTDFDVLTRELLTHNPVADTLEKVTAIQGNASYVLTWAAGNLTQIAKTVGATTYTKTLTWTNGDLTGISVWS
jgi:hypothetical protein